MVIPISPGVGEANIVYSFLLSEQTFFIDVGEHYAYIIENLDLLIRDPWADVEDPIHVAFDE
jgi:hypothetical protein